MQELSCLKIQIYLYVYMCVCVYIFLFWGKKRGRLGIETLVLPLQCQTASMEEGKQKALQLFFFSPYSLPHLAENPTFVREVVEGDQKRSGWGFLQATTRETKRDGLMRMCEQQSIAGRALLRHKSRRLVECRSRIPLRR